ncbi:MAG TPA: energy transducer TonB [Thermoanaerobaculia bacterium]|nr:energy transducer TonB [Thermoanaerobaculia bacterium]
MIVRWYDEIADFKGERAGKVFGLDRPDGLDDDRDVPLPPPTVTAAFYEGRRLIAEIPIDRIKVGEVLVADSGRYFAVVRGLGGVCTGRTTERDSFVTIYQADGRRVGTLTAGDVLNVYDIERLSPFDINWELRHESEEREVVVLSIPNAPKGKQELRVDLATAVMLDLRREIFPSPHAYATAAAGPAGSYETPSSPDCVAAYDAANLVRVDSSRFVAQAVQAPAPELPRVALLVRMRASVVVDVIVSESGDVICTRSTAKPFGLSAAAVEAAKRWKFRPFGGRVAGEILFRFEDVDEESWHDLVRRSPYH